MPASLADGTFRSQVESEAERLEALSCAIESEASLDVLERVHGLYGYIGKGYVHSEGHDPSVARSVPTYLSNGWIAVSERVGRQPTIDYADCVLYNWERIDPNAAITPENIRLLNRFTGLMDEEWFLKTHVIIESEASGVVAAIFDACNAIRRADKERLLAMLAWLEQAMSHVTSNCLWIMFEREDDSGYLCEPDLFYHRFRPYISTWTALFEGQYEDGEKLAELREQLEIVDRLSMSSANLPSLDAQRNHITAAIAALQKRKRLAGPSGAMSTLLPLCDAFLDIRMSSEELRRTHATLEEYMPANHRRFLEDARKCSARDFINLLIAENDEQAETLVDAFNAVVRRVLDFRWKYLRYIEQYIIKPSDGTNPRGAGGAHALAHPHQEITDTESAMLEMPVAFKLCDFSKADEASPTADYFPDLRTPTTVDDNPLRELSLWAVTHINGLLPTSPPVSLDALPPSWGAVVQLSQQLPAACLPPTTFHQLTLDASTRFPSSCDGLGSESLLERARSVLAYVVAGWSAASTHLEDKPPLPARLAALFGLVCQRIGRAPRLTLVDLTLYNWVASTEEDDELSPPASDSGSGDSTSGSLSPTKRKGVPWPRLVTMGSIKPIQRFICVEEEDWFCRLHVTLAAESGEVLRSVKRCMRASGAAEQASALQRLERSMEVLVNVHYAAGIGETLPVGLDVPKVAPALLMRRLHRFMPHVPEIGLDRAEQRAARIYCCTGIDQSCLMHLLGVPRGTHALSRFRDWMESEKAAELPAGHRSFLSDILNRTSLHEEVERAVGVKELPVPELARLELAHNACIDMLLRYFMRRIELVRTMLGEDSLRACYGVERANIQSARLRLLVERREMVGLQEGLDTRAKFYKRDPGERGV